MVDRSFYVKRDQYKTLRNKTVNILSYLKESKNNIIDCNRVDSYLMIDDECFAKSCFNESVDNITNYISVLENKIIPSIDNCIRSLDREISSLEMNDN